MNPLIKPTFAILGFSLITSAHAGLFSSNHLIATFRSTEFRDVRFYRSRTG